MRRSVPTALCAALAALLVVAAPASARQLVTHSLSSSFDGGGSTAGQFTFSGGPTSVAVDEVSGNVYAVTSQSGLPIDKFDASGVPAHYSAPELAGSTSLYTPGLPTSSQEGVRIAVDNSAGPTQGRIYEAFTTGAGSFLYAYGPSGRALGGNFPLTKANFSSFFPSDVAVDPSSGDIWVAGEVGGALAVQLTPEGVPTGVEISAAYYRASRITVDSEGNVYLKNDFGNCCGELPPGLYKYNSAGEFQYKLPLSAEIDADPSNGDLYTAGFSAIAQYDKSGSLLPEFGAPISVGGIAVNGASGKVYAVAGGIAVSIFGPGATVTVPDVSTEAASNFEPSVVTVHGTVDPEGLATTDCRFEWNDSSGEEFTFGKSTPCAGGNPSGPGPQPVTATIGGLKKGETYRYRLSATNANGKVVGLRRTFSPSAQPTISSTYVSDVHSDSARFHLVLNPGGAETTYVVEYGPADCSSNPCQAAPAQSAGGGVLKAEVSSVIAGLQPDTTYHYRILATNQSGTAIGPDRSVTTFPFIELLEDPCPNAHARQQTSAALLLDCRAYELVSAANTGGYDVESDQVEGQRPFDGYPLAQGRVLYGVHEGAIPGTGLPTNHGVDPYVAIRGEHGWSTQYVGIPSNNPFASGPFASGLLEANPTLTSFAFGGEGICEPCFEDGSTNVPVRLPDGGLVEGMVGSLKNFPNPSGYLAKRFAADGTHFVFGTTTKLEPSANNGKVTIYERDLAGGPTEVVSTLPSGATIANEVGELDVSADGSRTIVGQKLGTDAKGNVYYHPYMHLAGSTHSVDLAPGATTGVLWAGMTEGGSSAFFTTKDKLLVADTDTSADLYEAHVDAEGHLTLRLLSLGQSAPAGNTNSCVPSGKWNNPAGINDCSVLAVAGGAGVAAETGAVYFLSPELLAGAGKGTVNLPNLYVVRPEGPPTFVATLEASTKGIATNPALKHALGQAATHSYGDFQVTPDGSYAVFASTQPLTGYENGGRFEVFRYAPASGELVCASCDPTNAAALGDASLATHGLSLTDDGRVFFDSADPIAPRDLDGRQDVYEYEEGEVQLISTGTSPFASSLLGVSADGADALFFTRDTLVPQDENGSQVKIYDARAEGGFAFLSQPLPCKASDECHGAGSEVPPPPAIRTLEGQNGNLAPESSGQPSCKAPKVRRHGRCVKLHPPHKAHHHKSHKRAGARGRRHG